MKVPTKSVTMDDVAREAGVSRALVSIAYRGVAGVSEETKKRVFAAADKLGYRPNRIAATLASKVSNTLGIFLQDLRNDIFADIFDGVREVANINGRHLVLAIGDIDGGMDARALDTLLQSRVDVVIAAGLVLPDVAVRQFARTMPMVSVMRLVEGVDGVYSDNLAGARAATRHLISLGHRRIAFLANPQTDGYLDRQRGFLEQMEAARLEPQIIPSHYSRGLAAQDIGEALDSTDCPTAIFAHNDQAALGVLDAMASRGLHAPADISVVGYDNSGVSKAPGTELTTVNLHGRKLGRDAAAMALQRLADPSAPANHKVRLPSLVVRTTTGPVAR